MSRGVALPITILFHVNRGQQRLHTLALVSSKKYHGMELRKNYVVYEDLLSSYYTSNLIIHVEKFWIGTSEPSTLQSAIS